MAKYRTHICASVRGMLRWDRRFTKKMLKTIKKDDGTLFRTVEEFRESLMDELANGHEVVPLGEACEGFDYKVGCPGHLIPEENAES